MPLQPIQPIQPLERNETRSFNSDPNIAFGPIVDEAWSRLKDALVSGKPELHRLREHLNSLRSGSESKTESVVYVLEKLALCIKKFVADALDDEFEVERNPLRFAPGVILEFGWQIQHLTSNTSAQLFLSAYSLALKNGDKVSAGHALAAFCAIEPNSEFFESMFTEVFSWKVEESAKKGILSALFRFLDTKAKLVEKLPKQHSQYSGQDGDSGSWGDEEDLALSDSNGRHEQVNKLCIDVTKLYMANRKICKALIEEIFQNSSETNFLVGEEYESSEPPALSRLTAYDAPLVLVTTVLKVASLARSEQLNPRASRMLTALRSALEAMPDDSWSFKETLRASVMIEQGLNSYFSALSAGTDAEKMPLTESADQQLQEGIEVFDRVTSHGARDQLGLCSSDLLILDINRMRADAFYVRALILSEAESDLSSEEIKTITGWLDQADHFSSLMQGGDWEFREWFDETRAAVSEMLQEPEHDQPDYEMRDTEESVFSKSPGATSKPRPDPASDATTEITMASPNGGADDPNTNKGDGVRETPQAMENDDQNHRWEEESE